MVRETIPCAVTSSSVSLKVIWAELSSVNPAPTSPQTQTGCPCKSIRLWKCVQPVSWVQRREPQSGRREHTMWNVSRWGCWYWGQPHLSVTMNPRTAGSLTEEPCNFIGLLLLNLLIIQSFKEDVQDQYIFSGERTDKSTPRRGYFCWYHITLNDISHFPCNYLSLLLHWRWTMETQVMLCHRTSIHQQKKEKRLRSKITDCYQIILTQYTAQFCWIS